MTNRWGTAPVLLAVLAGSCSGGDETTPPPAHHVTTEHHHAALPFAGHEEDPATTDIVGHIDSCMRHDSHQYEETLERLRAHGEDAVEVLVDQYHALPPAAHGDRWMMVHMVGEVHHTASLGFLEEVTNEPLPEGNHEDLGGHGDVHPSGLHLELAVHLAAIRGIQALAADGHAVAREALFSVLSRGVDEAVAAGAVLAVLDTSEDEAAARHELLAALPEDQLGLVELTWATAGPPDPPEPNAPPLSDQHNGGEAPQR